VNAARTSANLGPGRSQEQAWLIWATQGEYSDRTEWPIAIALDQATAEARTERLGQLWRHLCAEYDRREDELDAADDWQGRAIYDSEEGREFLALSTTPEFLDSFVGYAQDRMYICSPVPIISAAPESPSPKNIAAQEMGR